MDPRGQAILVLVSRTKTCEPTKPGTQKPAHLSAVHCPYPVGHRPSSREAPTHTGGHQLWGRAGSELSHHDDKGQTWALTFNSENRRTCPRSQVTGVEIR